MYIHVVHIYIYILYIYVYINTCLYMCYVQISTKFLRTDSFPDSCARRSGGTPWSLKGLTNIPSLESFRLPSCHQTQPADVHVQRVHGAREWG